MRWPLQDAKNQFSKLVRQAEKEGPQTVTIRGMRAAVVLSAVDYDALVANKPSLVDHLFAGPRWEDDLADTVAARGTAPSRAIDF